MTEHVAGTVVAVLKMRDELLPQMRSTVSQARQVASTLPSAFTATTAAANATASAVRGAGAATGDVRGRFSDLFKQIEQTRASITRAKADIDQLKVGTQQTDTTVGGLNERLRDSRGRFLAAGEAAKEFGRDVDGSHRGVTGLLSSLGSMGRTVVATMAGFVGAQAIMRGVRAAFGFIKEGAIDTNATLETTELQFRTLMGSADRAKEHVRDLFDFAAKTPFAADEIIQASRMMRTFGGDALDTRDNLKLLGDASAAVSAPIQDLGFWVGRLYSSIQSGRPFGEAAMRLQELAVLSPRARAEMERLQEAGADGSKIFGVFQQDLQKFSGSMELQAGTWKGVVSSLKDNINLLLADTLRPFFETFRDGMGLINKAMGSDAVQQAAASFKASIQDAFGKDSQAQVQSLASGMITFGTTVLTVAEIAYRGFHLIKAGVTLMVGFALDAFAKVHSISVGAMKMFAEFAKAPGSPLAPLAKGFEGQATMLAERQKWLQGMADGFGKSYNASADAAVGTDAFVTGLRGMHTVLETARTSLSSVNTETAKVSDTTKQAAAAAAVFGDAMSKKDRNALDKATNEWTGGDFIKEANLALKAIDPSGLIRGGDLSAVYALATDKQVELNKLMQQAMLAAARNGEVVKLEWLQVALATEKARDATDEYVKTIVKGFSGDALFQDANRMVSAMAARGGVDGLLPEEMQRVGALMSDAITKAKAVGATIPPEWAKVWFAVQNVTGSLDNLKAIAPQAGDALKDLTLSAELPTLKQNMENILSLAGQLPPALEEASDIKPPVKEWDDWHESLMRVAQTFDIVGQNATGALAGIARGLATITAVFADGGKGPVMAGIAQMTGWDAETRQYIKTSVQNRITGGLGLAAGFMGAASQVGAIEAARTTGSKSDRITNTMAAGAQMGMAFGPWGAAIGAGWGALVGALSDPAEQARKIARSWSDDIVAVWEASTTAAEKAVSSINNLDKIRSVVTDAYEDLGLTREDALRDLADVQEASAISAEAVAKAVGHINEMLERQAQLRDTIEQRDTLKRDILNQAVERYEISFDAAGKGFQRGNLADRAEELILFRDALIESGMDESAVMTAMAEDISALAADTKRAGLDLPNELRSSIEDLVEMRLLRDEHGNVVQSADQFNFSDDLKPLMQDELGKLDEIIAELKRINAAPPGHDPSITSVYTGAQARPRVTADAFWTQETAPIATSEQAPTPVAPSTFWNPETSLPQGTTYQRITPTTFWNPDMDPATATDPTASYRQMHVGGMVEARIAHNGWFVNKFKSDEVPVLAQTGEGILNRNATANIGGAGAINHLNAGGSLGSDGGRGGDVFNVNGSITVVADDPMEFAMKMKTAVRRNDEGVTSDLRRFTR